MWLVVLGTGKWVHKSVRYEAGIHEVDDEVAAAARRSPSRSLRVFEEKPEIVRESSIGPLTPDDIKLGVRGVQLRKPEEPEVEAEFVRPTRDYDFDCKLCPYTAPSGPARDRHVEFEHALPAV